VGSALARVLGNTAICATRVPSDAPLAIDLSTLPSDPDSVKRIVDKHEINAVFCAGGATDVERCELDQEWAFKTNCDGPVALAAAAKHLPFVYYSTDYIFDGKNGPHAEDDQPRPLSIYGKSKLLGELGIREIHPNALIIRTTVVYGPDPLRKNFLYTLRRVLSSGGTLSVPSDQISTPTFNEDLARASVQLVTAGQAGTFHVCGQEVLSRYEFALHAVNALGLDMSLLKPVATSDLGQIARRPLRAGLLTQKLVTALPGFRMRSVAEGISAWRQGAH
jgi:dTDP-4-dehydrorhamnose reductase